MDQDQISQFTAVMSNGDGHEPQFRNLMMMGPMHMYVYFDSSCVFVFKTWRTNLLDDDWMFFLGCVLCAVYGVFHMAIPFAKEQYLKYRTSKISCEEKKSQSSCPIDVKIILGAFYFFYTMSNFMMMMIMMTMNGYVLIALAVGLTTGYWLFSSGKSIEELTPNQELCHS